MEEGTNLADSFREVNASFVGFKRKETGFTSKAEIFYYAGNSWSCINCFIMMRPRVAVGATASKDCDILWSHPLNAVAVPLQYTNLAQFALVNDSGTANIVDQLAYTFVLTNSNGVREYGHCTAFVNGEVAVVLSPYPWCNFFYRIARLYNANGVEEGQRMIRALCSAGTPPSGADFVLPHYNSLQFRRPYDRLCSFIDTSPVNMIYIFPNNDHLFGVLVSLLLEKHVIIAGPNFPLVSNVVMSLQALLSPFDWMHILIPILPTSLIDMLAAPPPYLVGILTSQLRYLEQVSLEGVVVVHLDDRGICERLEYVNEEEDHLPHSGMFSALRIGLSILRLRDPRDQTVRDLCSLFLTYYATLFGEVVLKGGKGYIKAQNLSDESRAFFEKLLTTQSFYILSEEVTKVINKDNLEWMDNEFIVATVRGHKEVFPNRYAELIEEEKHGGGYLERYGECFGSRENFNGITAAVHGFGGHKLGVTRLIMHCLCGSRASNSDSIEETASAWGLQSVVSLSRQPHSDSYKSGGDVTIEN